MSDQAKEIWAAGDAYEAYVGRWSCLAAREFAGWLGVPSGLRWLDVGCGTGALSRAVLDRCAPATLMGIDPSESFVAHARRHTADPRAEFRIGDARALPIDDAAFDVAVSGLVLNFVPDHAKAVAEMNRAVRPSTGVVAAYVWDYAGEMQMIATSGTRRSHWIRLRGTRMREPVFRCAAPSRCATYSSAQG